MSFLTNFSLIRLLIVTVVAELLFNRLAPHIVDTSVTNATWLAIFDRLGLFAFAFSSLLGWFVYSWGCLRLVRDPVLLTIPWRIVLTLFSATCMVLLGLATLVRLPAVASLLLMLASAAFAGTFVIALMRHKMPFRARMMLVLLMLPLLCHHAGLAFATIPALSRYSISAWLQPLLYGAGERLFIVSLGAAAVFICQLHPTAHPWRSRVVAGTLALVALGYLHRAPALSQQFLTYGFNLRSATTPGVPFSLVTLVTLFLLIMALLRLYAGSPAQRAIGEGLCLVMLAGYHFQIPCQLTFALVGILQIARGLLADHLGIATYETNLASSSSVAALWHTAFQKVLQEWAQPSDSIGVATIEEGSVFVVRGRAERGGVPLTLRLNLEHAQPRHLEVAIGKTFAEEPPAMLFRSRLPLGARFANHFRLVDKSNCVTDILGQAEIADDLSRSIFGPLSLWPREGLLYVEPSGKGNALRSPTELTSLTDLLHFLTTLAAHLQRDNLRTAVLDPSDRSS